MKDPRVDKLAEMSQSKKIVYANIEFVDIAGLVKGAAQGEGLGNKFLSHIREVDAVVQVVRHFKDTEVVHVHETIDIMRDIEVINTELILADLEIIERHLPNIAKRAKTTGNKDDRKLSELLMEIKTILLEGKASHGIKEMISKDDFKLLKPFNLLTLKPFIYAINIGQEDIPYAHEIAEEFMVKLQSPVSVICAKLESEMMSMGEEEKQQFMQELLEMDKIAHIPTLDDLIALAFKKVGLMYYFTTGEKETKAWTTPL